MEPLDPLTVLLIAAVSSAVATILVLPRAWDHDRLKRQIEETELRLAVLEHRGAEESGRLGLAVRRLEHLDAHRDVPRPRITLLRDSARQPAGTGKPA